MVRYLFFQVEPDAGIGLDLLRLCAPHEPAVLPWWNPAPLRRICSRMATWRVIDCHVFSACHMAR
jgi:hypothetical protein